MINSKNTRTTDYASKPIFIGGTGRSGTTMLTKVLNRHKDVAAFGEIKVHLSALEVLYDIYKTPDSKDVLIEEFKQMWFNEFFKYTVPWKTKDGNDNIRGLTCWFQEDDIKACINYLTPLSAETPIDEAYLMLGRFWDALFQIYARHENKLYWAEKTPPNALAAPVLMKCFPAMKMINVIRDGRDVACSLATMDWGIKDPCRALDWWAAQLVQALQRQKNMPAGTIMNVRYEDLIQYSRKAMERIIRFLGLNWDEEILEHNTHTKSLSRYKKDLSPEVQNYAVKKYGHLFKMLHYPVD